ncbi:GerAB/ArcD/ProY family transporter [Gorillibacterium sp. sgz5001074]|uniref:GerAB/ArcD/ProY family transporter n=1 Tax=Gorillibacterium sp. sgz5001074 TaxID=3446695 RepID=UPI003F66B436
MKPMITNIQAIVLLYTTVTPTAILTIPGVVMTHAKQDAWISILMATLLGVCAALLVGTIVAHNPGITVQAWVTRRLGRFAGTAVSLLLAYYYITISTIILREFTGIMTSQILPHTPIFIVMIIILIVTGYAVVSGLEAIARSNVFVTAISMVPYFFSLLLFQKLIDFGRLWPFFQHPPGVLAYSGLLPAGWFSEIAVLLILAPYLKHRSKARKIALWGVGLSGFHLTVTVILAILVFGPNLPQLYQYPSFSMIEVIRIGTTLERIDILFSAFWICTIYIKMAIFLFGAYHCLLEALHLRPSKTLLGALLLFIMLSSVSSYRDDVHFGQVNRWGTPYELLSFNLLLPLLIGIGLWLRRDRPPKPKGESAV